MASLDDASGNSAALTSEVIQIGTSDNTSCISTAANATGPSTFRLLNTTISQCSPFSVFHNSSSLDYPISVRVLIPTGLSSWLQRTSFYSGQGVDTFTFIMSVARGFQIALLFDDGQGNRQVSDLLSVAGGESTPTNCLQIASSTTSTAAASASSFSRSAPLSAIPHLRLIRLQVRSHYHCCCIDRHCCRGHYSWRLLRPSRTTETCHSQKNAYRHHPKPQPVR